MTAVTQATEIRPLLKDQKLSPDIAARELLINCYAAARPDAAWFRRFREGIEQVVGDLEKFVSDPQNSLVLQAARRRREQGEDIKADDQLGVDDSRSNSVWRFFFECFSYARLCEKTFVHIYDAQIYRRPDHLC